jgi:hypothetical protein
VAKRTVETEFTAKDAGYTETMRKVGETFSKTGESLKHLGDRFNDFRREQNFTAAAMLGVSLSLGGIIEKAKEATGEFGRTTKGIAGLLAQNLAFERGASGAERFTRSMVVAREVTEELDETAARFGMELSDLDPVYRKTAVAAGALGLTQKQVLDLSVSVGAASKAFGVSGEQAATTIARAMSSRAVRGVDEFSLSMKQALGNLKGLSNAQVFERVQRGLRDSVSLAEAMGQGIGGSLARIRNTVEDTIRDVAGPVFTRVGKRLEEWSKYLRQARDEGKPLIDAFADKLVKAFDRLESATRFMLDHWREIAAVIAAMKVKDIASQLQTTAAGISGMGAIGAGARGALGGLGRALSIASATIEVTGTAYLLGGILGKAAMDVVSAPFDRQMRSQEIGLAISGLANIGKYWATQSQGMLTERQTKLAEKYIKQLEAFGAISDGKLSARGLAAALNENGSLPDRALAERFGVLREFNSGIVPKANEALANRVAETLGVLAAQVIRPKAPDVKPDDSDKKFLKKVTNIYGGVHVQMKFDAPDPDRVFVRFREDLEDYVDRPTQGRNVEPLGD